MADTAGRNDAGVYSVTTAASSHSDDLQGRMRRYAISMSIRTACFVGALLTDGVLRWVLIAGAVVLPFAVIAASTGVRTRPTPGQLNPNVAAGAIDAPKSTGVERSGD